MKYEVAYTQQAVRELKKLDRSTRDLILSWISDPRRFGKGLTANRSSQWRYRKGYYRLIAEIDDGKVTILLLCVGHRREIY